ncbi:MAG: hypothetical protein ACI35N_09515, partial [Marinilabiliaceae bacterium]
SHKSLVCVFSSSDAAAHRCIGHVMTPGLLSEANVWRALQTFADRWAQIVVDKDNGMRSREKMGLRPLAREIALSFAKSFRCKIIHSLSLQG